MALSKPRNWDCYNLYKWSCSPIYHWIWGLPCSFQGGIPNPSTDEQRLRSSSTARSGAMKIDTTWSSGENSWCFDLFCVSFFLCAEKTSEKKHETEFNGVFYGAEKKIYPKHMKLFFWWQEWEVRESRIKFSLPWGSGGWCTRALARPDWGRIIWWDTSWTPTSF